MTKYGKLLLTTVGALLLAVSAIVMIPCYVHAASSQGTTELVSVASDGSLPNNSSGATKVSPDGRYVYFISYASNLVPNDTNNAYDIFVRDRLLGTTTMLDVNSSGQEGNEGVVPGMDVSDDGRYLVYASSSTNLVPQDYYNSAELYIRDLQTGTTSLLFRNSFTGQGAGGPVISGDGNWIAFDTYLPYPFGTDQGTNVYLINRSTLALTHISNALDGSSATSGNPSINYDGSRIAFDSQSTNLVPNDTNGFSDIFLWDKGTNSISRVSVSSTGTQTNNYSEFPKISGDSNRIVYFSYATNLTPNGTTPYQFKDYLYDVGTGTTTLIDVTPTGQEGNAGPNQPDISEDGNFAVFSSAASDLVSGDTNDAPDVFVRDLQTNTTSLVSYDTNEDQFTYGAGGTEALNSDGRFVAFNGAVPLEEVFLRDTNPLPPAPTNLAASSPTQTPVLTWSTVAGATSYKVYRDGTLLGSAPTPSFTDSSASEGSHQYYVTAVNGAGESGPSNTITIQVVVAASITSASAASAALRQPFNFTITTTGSPTPAITESGALPAGITFQDNGDGTATLSGTAAVGSASTYPLRLTATNGVGTLATQNFTLTVSSTTSLPMISSSTSDTESYGLPFSFTVTTTGYPAPALSKTGTLPTGVTFTDNHDGSATISGTPSGSAAGVYALTFKAKSSAGTATQSFTFTITKAPVIKPISTKTAKVGQSFMTTLTSTGYTTPALSLSGNLPGGLHFTDNGNSTGTLSGTPTGGAGGSYSLTLMATNSYGTATQNFTLKVLEAPAITSTNTATATIGQAFSFPVTTTGYPTPAVTKTSTLPSGITFNAATDTFSGTPKAGTAGTYPITITAKNSSGTVTQSFVLTVQ